VCETEGNDESRPVNILRLQREGGGKRARKPEPKIQ